MVENINTSVIRWSDNVKKLTVKDIAHKAVVSVTAVSFVFL